MELDTTLDNMSQGEERGELQRKLDELEMWRSQQYLSKIEGSAIHDEPEQVTEPRTARQELFKYHANVNII